MSKLQFELLPNETVIDTWTLLYIPPSGGKYNGKCTITNKRIFYDALLDYSAAGIATSFFFVESGSKGYLMIPKSSIKKTEVKKSLFNKSVALTLDDNQVHTFSYGAMNIDKVVEAINVK